MDLNSKASTPKTKAKPTKKDNSGNALAAWGPVRDQTLYLIDISSFIFRAFYAVRHLSTRDGEPTNAVFGVASMLSRLASEADPRYLAVVYDSKGPSFRKEMYAEYKANRTEPPEDLIPQFDRIEAMISSFEIHSYRQSGVEADDLIATLADRWTAGGDDRQVVIVSSDKDLMQLVNGRVCLWDTMKDKVFDEAAVVEKFGVQPIQVRDYLGIVGDTSDNIPGVPSIGPKGAATLLNEYGDLDAILKAAHAGKIKGKRGEVLQVHEANARLSAELATVKRDLDHVADPADLEFSFKMTNETVQLFGELEFHTLVNRWPKKAERPASDTPDEAVATATSDSARFSLIQKESDFTELLNRIDQKKEFAFDLETTSLNPREAEVVGFAMSTGDDGVYVPVGHRGDGAKDQLNRDWVFDKLRPILENPNFKKIGQNLKYDWSVLWENGIQPDGIGADTMIASYVLEPSGRHNLDSIAAHYLGYSMMSYEDVCGKGKNQISFADVPLDVATRYAAEDAWIANRLWDHLRPQLEDERLMQVFAAVDMPLVEILGRMESFGVNIDVSWLETLSKRFESELEVIDKKILEHSKEPINLNSPKQLAKFLFEDLGLPVQTKTKTGYSTDAKVLNKLAPLHEVPRLILEHREIAKLKGTYVDPLPLLRDEKTGKIHASFHQTVAATGRLSSSDPNLQNIPVRTERGRLIRRAFIPSEGNVLLSADYSQIELRILAHMSEDKELRGSFERDEDVHQRTASEIFDCSPEDVTESQRGAAKAINFGLMYGKSAFGLAQELKISRKEAQGMIDRYFERYSGVSEFLDGQIERAKQDGFVTTLLGRKRQLPEIRSSNHMARMNAERMAMNTPIQGTAADLMKLAMIDLEKALRDQGFESRMIVQVHDEVLLDCPREEVSEVEQLVRSTLEGAMEMSVPLKVNCEQGENWMDL